MRPTAFSLFVCIEIAFPQAITFSQENVERGTATSILEKLDSIIERLQSIEKKLDQHNLENEQLSLQSKTQVVTRPYMTPYQSSVHWNPSRKPRLLFMQEPIPAPGPMSRQSIDKGMLIDAYERNNQNRN